MKTKTFFLLTILAFLNFFQISLADVLSDEGLDVNDVSLLFPLLEGKPQPSMSLIRSEILSEKVFSQILGFEKMGILSEITYMDRDGLVNLDSWYVTAIRIDHCGMGAHANEIQDRFDSRISILKIFPSGQCHPQLRLVTQPFNGFGFPFPSAIHITYELSENLFSQLLKGLVELKKNGKDRYQISTSRKTLDVHPVLKYEAENEQTGYSLGLSLKKILLDTIKDQDSSPFMATLIVRDSINHWKFVGGLLHNGSWKRFVTNYSYQFFEGPNPEIQTGVEDLLCNIFSLCQLTPTHLPKTFSTFGYQLNDLFQLDSELHLNQIPSKRTELAYARAEEIDQTSKTNFFNTSCISCHESSNLRNRSSLGNPMVTELNNHSGPTPFVQKKYLNTFANNVINFGYFGSSIRISTRTASESMRVAHSLNKNLGLKQPFEEELDWEKVWVCLMSGKNDQECL